MIAIRTIDAHVGGAPLRLIVDGFPAPRSRTMAGKRAWADRHADRLRRIVMCEPRGHRDMRGAVLTEPVTPGSHAGVLFMDNGGYTSMSGHGIVAVTTIILERGLVTVPDGHSVTFDTPAGTIRARAERTGDRIGRVTFVNVPSFVLQGGVDVRLGTRALRADVAFGGAFYAIVDSESAGIPLDAGHLDHLRRAGVAIATAVEAIVTVAHPIDADPSGIAGTVFIGPSHDGSADLRNVTVSRDGSVDRSASGTGTSAVMSVLDVMGLLDPDRDFTNESLVGASVCARIAGRTVVAPHAAIVVEVDGRAWITGDHSFVVDDDDPMREGVQL